MSNQEQFNEAARLVLTPEAAERLISGDASATDDAGMEFILSVMGRIAGMENGVPVDVDGEPVIP